MNAQEIEEVRALVDQIEQLKRENESLEQEIAEQNCSVVLTYFHGRGRAEQARWLLAAAGVTFRNRCLDTNAELEELRGKGDLMFGQLPLLEINGEKLVQSQSINRYIAREYGLYGSSPSEAARCDMIADAVADFQPGWLRFAFDGAADPAAYVAAHAQPKVEKWAPKLDAAVAANSSSGSSGGFCVGSSLTYADVLLADCLTSYSEMMALLDGGDGGDAWLKPYPALKRTRDMVVALPGVAAYLADPTRRFAFPAGESASKYVDNVDMVLARNKYAK